MPRERLLLAVVIARYKNNIAGQTASSPGSDAMFRAMGTGTLKIAKPTMCHKFGQRSLNKARL